MENESQQSAAPVGNERREIWDLAVYCKHTHTHGEENQSRLDTRKRKGGDDTVMLLDGGKNNDERSVTEPELPGRWRVMRQVKCD